MFNCPDLSGCKKFTICFWAKIEDDANITTNWGDIIGFTDQKADNSSTGDFRAETHYTAAATDPLRYVHWHDNATNAISEFVVYHTIAGDTQRSIWHHCAIAVDANTGVWAYTDGNPKSPSGVVTMNGGHLTGQFWLGETNKIQGVINDVRIYKDEILSPKVIKEISKGLVCHYTLSGGGGDNLATNSADLTKWTKESGITCLWDSTKQMYKVQSTSTSSRWGIWQQVPCDPNTTYTFSVEGVKTDQNMFLSVGSMASGAWPGNYTAFTTERKRLSYTWTTGSDHTVIRMYLAIYPTAEGSKTGYYALPKLEKGSIATPWTPNPADPEYTKMGFDDGIEYDVSGYGHNGTKTGTITYDTDAPRYWTSSKFNRTNSIIKAESLPAETKTISVWVKTTWSSSGYQMIFHDLNTKLAAGFSDTRLITYVGSGNGGAGSQIQTAGIYKANEWNHIIIVKTGDTTRDVYINGVLMTTYGANYWGGDLNEFNIGGRHMSGSYNAYFDGLISDLRVYATALSADDILALYNTPISLTSNGTLLTQGEFTEV